MSQLQLSGPLVQQIQELLASHDEQARNPGVAIQYLAALMGFLLAQQNLSSEDKRELLEQLCGFSRQVLEDLEQPPQQPPRQEVFGVWRAPKNRG